MFGFPAAFVGGNLATSLYEDRWLVRLGAEEADRLIAAGTADAFEPMAGRTMKGYVVLPPVVVDDDEAIGEWVGQSLAYAATLAPKG